MGVLPTGCCAILMMSSSARYRLGTLSCGDPGVACSAKDGQMQMACKRRCPLPISLNIDAKSRHWLRVRMDHLVIKLAQQTGLRHCCAPSGSRRWERGERFCAVSWNLQAGLPCVLPGKTGCRAGGSRVLRGTVNLQQIGKSAT